MDLPHDAILRLLDTWPVARLATLRPDGAATLVPVVFAYEGGSVWVPVDGKPKLPGELARVENIRRDPRVALLLDQYDADWSALWWLRAEGEARLVGEGAPGFTSAAHALLRKYPQYRHVPLFRPGAAPALVSFEPKRLTSWAASPDFAEFLS